MSHSRIQTIFFNQEKAKTLYNVIKERVDRYDVKDKEAEAMSDNHKSAVMVARMEELDWIVEQMAIIFPNCQES